VEQQGENIPDKEKDMDNGAEKQNILCVHTQKIQEGEWCKMRLGR